MATNKNNLRLVSQSFDPDQESDEPAASEVQFFFDPSRFYQQINIGDVIEPVQPSLFEDREHHVAPDPRAQPNFAGHMSTPTREEFEARLETVEARMDARVAKIEGKIDTLIAQMSERDRSQEERDKRIEMLAASAAKSAEQASTLKANMWLAALTVVVAVVGTVVAAYYATQSSNIGITQTVVAAFQQGQSSAPPPAKK